MKNIDVVDMGGHRSMGRDAARGMVRIAKCTLILVSEKKRRKGKIKLSRVRSVLKGYVKAAYCQIKTYCQNEMQCCHGPGASPC